VLQPDKEQFQSVVLHTHSDAELIVTPDHHITLDSNGADIPAKSLKRNDVVTCASGPQMVRDKGRGPDLRFVNTNCQAAR